MLSVEALLSFEWSLDSSSASLHMPFKGRLPADMPLTFPTKRESPLQVKAWTDGETDSNVIADKALVLN